MLENRDQPGEGARPTPPGTQPPFDTAVMKVLWDCRHPLSIQDIIAELHVRHDQEPGYTQVLSAMSALVERGAVNRNHDDRGYTYEAVLHDPAAADTQLLDRLQRFLRDED